MKPRAQLPSVAAWLSDHRRTGKWLGEKLGHDKWWASKLLTGTIRCSVPVLVKLADITGIDLETLAKECR